MRWVRVLQPCRYALSLIPKDRCISDLRVLLRPLCSAGDLVASKAFRPLQSSDQTVCESNLDVETLLDAFPDVVGRRALLPDYTKDGLGWLLGMAAKKEQYGKLQKVAVKDTSGGMLGWYMYYGIPGNVAHVLQFAARKKKESLVLNQMFAHAKARGCVAVMGGIDTQAVKEFSENQCFFFLRSMHTAAYSQDPEIISALLKGDAFITRLEGEWWTRLQGDAF
jgi:hypothetical protein